MAIWTENRKCMLVGGSGLQYRATISCAKPLDSVALLVRDFYQKKRAVLREDSGVNTLAFSRGREWISMLSPVSALSEKWPRQTITLSAKTVGDTTLVEVSYDVRIFFTMIVAPNALVKEVRELRSILEK